MAVLGAEQVFRDFVEDGNPASGPHEVQKAEARDYFSRLEGLVGSAIVANLIYDSVATLLSNTGAPENTAALVVGDSGTGTDGLYIKRGVGAVPSWDQLTDFIPGAQFVKAVDEGLGTANAIEAVTTVSVSAAASQLIHMNVSTPNTDSPVLLKFNGGDFLTIKTASGGDPTPYSLPSQIIGVIQGTTFKLITDLPSAALMARMELVAAATQEYALLAQTASDAAFNNADVFASTALGLAGTVVNDQFTVVVDSELVRYRHDAGPVATELVRTPSVSFFAGIKFSISEEGVFSIRNSEGVSVFYTSPEGLVTIDALATKEIDITDGLDLTGDGKNPLRVDLSNGGFRIVNSEGNSPLWINDEGTVYINSLVNEGLVSTGDATHAVGYAWVECGQDPSNSVAVSWRSTSLTETVMEYRVEGSSVWSSANSRWSRAFPALAGVYLHTVLLTGLDPATRYEFKIVNSVFSDIFRTSAQRNIKVGYAADYQQYDFSNTGRLGTLGAKFTSENCDLLLWLGDYVNDNGLIDATMAARWDGFLPGITANWRNNGALVAMIFAIGNHEVGEPGSPGTTNIYGGDGVAGPITSICYWGYEPDHPTTLKTSAAWFKVGSEFAFVGLDGDFVSSIASQATFLQDRLADLAPSVRHVTVASHAPAFVTTTAGAWENYDTQARALRNQVWPIMQPHASKIRMFISGHEHVLTDTGKKSMRYDSGQSLAANDTRWETGDADGVRQIVIPTAGATLYDVSVAKAGLVSSIDASTQLIAGLGNNGTTYTTYGTGITSPNDDTHGFAVANYNTTEFRLKVFGFDGRTLYEIQETI